MKPARVGRPRKATARPSAREDLLRAAHELMTARSSIDVPVADIAAHAGLNVALVTYYFGGKDALLLELALRHQARLSDDLGKLLAKPCSAAAKLSLHVRAMIRAFRSVPYLQRLNHRILRASSDEAAQRLAEALVRPLASFYAKVVEEGVAEGIFRRVDPLHLYLTINGACDMLFSAQASLRFGFGVETVDDAAAEAYADHLVATLESGLLAER